MRSTARFRRPIGFAALLCALISASAFAAQPVASAQTEFARLLQQIKSARQSGDAKEVLSNSLELAKLLHYSGPATEQVAMAYAGVGDRHQALDWLQRFAAMGQSDGKLASRPQFDALKSLPDFKRILTKMRENETPVDRATTVIRFGDAALVPEDIAYDAATRSFLVTSVLKKKIVRVGFDGRTEDFANSPDGWPMMAVKVDARRGIVWATEVALNHFAIVPKKDWDRSALLCFRLKDGGLIRKIDVPDTALGDMALMPNGDAIVTDGENGGVYRARAGCKDGNLQRLDSGQFLSPQTPAPAPDGKHVYLPDYVRGVALFDVDTGETRWINARRRHAMQGIDGLYWIPGGLLAVQNGASPERVLVFGLNGKLQVVREKPIDRSSPTLGDPTHGVVVGGNFYYIANSGWNALDAEGSIEPGAKPTPAVIKKVSLRHL